MKGGSRSRIKGSLKSPTGEFALDPEGDEKALKNSDWGWGLAGSAFLKGQFLGWVEGNSGWGWRQRMSKEAVGSPRR